MPSADEADAPSPAHRTPEQQSTPAGPRARCSCGHDYEHYMVSAENDYTFWGWVLVWTGVSAIPRRVRFRCRDCDEIFAETTDPALRRRYR